jgi:KAP family P-loop domain
MIEKLAASADKNKHVIDYLSYYISIPYPPHYAVMINGPWGIGKTYLVKKFLKQNFGQQQHAADRDADAKRRKRKNRKYVFVSLFGLATIDEFAAALFQAIYPALGWKTTTIGARVGSSLLKRYVGPDASFEIGDVINKFDADLFVFDDLERCEASLNKVLGYINEFVEHDGCKVIIIANEKEIDKGPEYENRREKIVGKVVISLRRMKNHPGTLFGIGLKGRTMSWLRPSKRWKENSLRDHSSLQARYCMY